MRRALGLLPLLLLSACGPVPVQEAERQCFEQARLAAAPRGTVGLGVRSDGKVAGGLELSISSDYLMGRDPSAVYDNCVFQKSGLPPTQPLYSRSDWKG